MLYCGMGGGVVSGTSLMESMDGGRRELDARSGARK